MRIRLFLTVKECETVMPANTGKLIEVIAHRGSAGYAPENTAAAFELAIEMKADLLELDLNRSKDNELIVIHDDTLDRTTNGRGFVASYTLEELRQLDAGSWFSKKFAGERLMTFGELLDLSYGRVGLLIEIKGPGSYPGIEQQIADELVARNMHTAAYNKRIVLQSFDASSVERFKRILPSVLTGVLVHQREQVTPPRLQQYAAYANYVNMSLPLATAKTIEMIHSLGLKAYPWTVRNRAEVQPLASAGVDGIITDYPDYTAELLGR